MKPFLILIIIFLSFYASAQTSFGIKAGVTFSKQNNSAIIYPEADLKFNKSFQTGIHININILPNYKFLYLQPELIFIQKGYEYSGVYNFGQTPVKYRDKVTYNYFEIPLNLKILIPPTPFFVLGGFYTAYCLDGYNKMVIEDSLSITDINISEKALSKFDAGFICGVGIQKGIGPTKFIMEGTFVKSLKEISNQPEISVKNKSFGISIGMQIIL